MHTLDTFFNMPVSGEEKKRRMHERIFGSCLCLSFTPIVYFHSSEAHTEQEPSTVALEGDYLVPLQVLYGVPLKYTYSSLVLFTEIRVFPVHQHDNGRQDANSCLRYRLNLGKVVYDQLVKPSQLSHPVSLHLSFSHLYPIQTFLD